MKYRYMCFIVLAFIFLTFIDLYSLFKLNTGNYSFNFLCEYITSLYVDLGEKGGCCRESPVIEPNTCYTSTNYLAEFVLRNICGRADLADRIKSFLNRYPMDFYDYYQVVLGKPITLPFVDVKHVEVDVVNGIRVVHVLKTNVIIEDYYRYSNLLIYKAIHHLQRIEVNKALEELEKLEDLFYDHGFADAYYNVSGMYETYKVALAIIVYTQLGDWEKAGKYREILGKIEPLTTLYTIDSNRKLIGRGDLNLETASLTLIALYIDNLVKKSYLEREFVKYIVLIILILILLLFTSTFILREKRIFVKVNYDTFPTSLIALSNASEKS